MRETTGHQVSWTGDLLYTVPCTNALSSNVVMITSFYQEGDQ